MKTRSILLLAGLAFAAWWVYQRTMKNGTGVQGMERRPVRLNDPKPPDYVVNCIRAPCGPFVDSPPQYRDPVLDIPPGPPQLATDAYWQGMIPIDGLLASGLPPSESGTNVSTAPTPFLSRPLGWINPSN